MHRCLLLLVLSGLSSFTVSHSNSVYHFIKEAPKNWSEAQQYCRQYYTDLATVYDMTDVERLTAAADRSDAWIGLYQTSDNIRDRKWHWSQPRVEYNESEAQWNSENGINEPTNGEFENCVLINVNRRWIDSNCAHQNPRCFICYNDSSKTNVTYVRDGKNWFEAQRFCREHHTDLISGLHQLNQIQTDMLKQTQTDMLKSCDEWWIGLYRDTWGWSDGSSSSFRNWQEWGNVLNQSPPNDKQCAKLGNQNKLVCDQCHIPKSFICYDEHFILVKENKTWEEALVHCRRQHRDLAWFTDEHLKRGVQERAKMADSEVVWVGLHYTCFLEAWISVNGHYVSEGNWKDPGTNDCGVSGAMERGGGNLWVKRSSQERHNFICAVH